MKMASRFLFLLSFSLALLTSSMASGAVVEHFFTVGNLTVQKLCNQQVITAVNESLPGPTIYIEEGDTLVVHVSNESPYNITIHWHGVFQKLSAWADGPNMITQCPIRPGTSYTYKFNVVKQEGTLWWHAHVSWLRATVYGALIIKPRYGSSYPFIQPQDEFPIILGEWWNANIVDVLNEGLASGGVPNNSDAFTINGFPGDLYSCSTNETYKLKVELGKTYLFRIINAALNTQLFFKIANHKLTVVGVDAEYTTPYLTDVVLVAPGQTTDVLLTANQLVGSYYMAASPYFTFAGLPFNNSTTRGVIEYYGASPSSTPVMPQMPAFNDTPTAHQFNSNLTSLVPGPWWVPVPLVVDEHMFITMGLGLAPCGPNQICLPPFFQRVSASMNNHSFVPPTTLSLLQAFFYDVQGVYTADFPNEPPIKFDYVNTTMLNNNLSLWFSPKSTSVRKFQYNTTVEIVFQNTGIIGVENHPMHIHGFNFHVLAQGFGNYDPITAPLKFNLVNPQMRNTIGVPVGGWAVVRFRTNNPGVWFIHCHLDIHLPLGLATAFLVENGPTSETQLPPPPADLPQC